MMESDVRKNGRQDDDAAVGGGREGEARVSSPSPEKGRLPGGKGWIVEKEILFWIKVCHLGFVIWGDF